MSGNRRFLDTDTRESCERYALPQYEGLKYSLKVAEELTRRGTCEAQETEERAALAVRSDSGSPGILHGRAWQVHALTMKRINESATQPARKLT